MEDHALATLALAQAYGLTGSKFLKEPSQRAVDFLVLQRGADLGWNATGTKDRPSDALATGWSLFALRSAEAAELRMPAGVVAESVRRLLVSTAGQPDLHDAFALAVHGSFMRNRGLPEVAGRMDRLAGLSPPAEARRQDALFALLGMTALATVDHEERKKAWEVPLSKALLQLQRGSKDGCASGSWDPVSPADAPCGRAITTALNTLALEVRYGYAGIFCGPLEVLPKK